MRNKETLILIAVLAFSFILLYGCASKKSTIKTEEDTVVNVEKKEMKADSTAFERLIDTTRRSETEVVFNRIEYYPVVITDSVSGTTRQVVKSVQRVTVQRKAEAKGVDSVAVCNKNNAKAEVRTDSTAAKKTDAKEETEAGNKTSLWWLYIIIALIIAIYTYNNTKS